MPAKQANKFPIQYFLEPIKLSPSELIPTQTPNPSHARTQLNSQLTQHRVPQTK